MHLPLFSLYHNYSHHFDIRLFAFSNLISVNDCLTAPYCFRLFSVVVVYYCMSNCESFVIDYFWSFLL